MDPKEEESAHFWKGARKVGLGILSFIFPPAGAYLFVAGAASFGFGTLLRLGGKLFGSKAVNNWGRNFQAMGIKAMITGGAMSFPLLSLGLIVEGAYNIKTGKQAAYGFEAISRVAARSKLAGLPQIGDPDYVHSRTGWQSHNTQPKPELEEVELTKLRNNSVNNKPRSQDAVDHSRVDDKHVVHSKPHPVQKTDKIDVKKIASSKDFTEATNEYNNQVKDANQKFIAERVVPHEKGGFLAVYVPPEYKGNETTCPPELKVWQHFDKDGNLIDVKTGKNATCITPPVKTGDNTFEIHSYANGTKTNERVSTHATTIRKLVDNHRDSTSSNVMRRSVHGDSEQHVP